MSTCDSQRHFSGINRRDFLYGSAAAAFSISRLARAQDVETKAKLDRISFLSNCFDHDLQAEIWDRSQPMAPKELNVMDMPEQVADRLHIHHMEICNINLLSMEPSYIKEFKGRMRKAKFKAVNMPIEIDPPATKYRGYISVCSPDPAIRAQALEMTKKWIDIAAVLECPSVMPNQGVHYLTDDLTPAIEGVKALIDYAKPKGIIVCIEPRGQKLDSLKALIKGSGAYANPQTGNVDELRYFYPITGKVQHITVGPRANVPVAIPLSKEMGYKGYFSIEAGGPDPWGTLKSEIDLLCEYL